MSRPFFLGFLIFLIGSVSQFATAQTILTCSATAVPVVVVGEGITERTGDLVMFCSGGTPGMQITGNLSIFLTVNITNRVTANNTVTDVVFTVDNGSGPQPVNVPGMITGLNSLVYNGVNFNLSSTGSATLRIANIRAAVNQLMLVPFGHVNVFLGFNSGNLVTLTNNQFSVATPLRGLFGGTSSKIVCAQSGSPLPNDTTSFASFLGSGAVFNSTRFTEGFADAFNPRGVWQTLNADTGVRIIVRYTGFPSGARLFVPDVIAGSDAVRPTAAGDYGVPASGGQYAPAVYGSLLLARVQSTDANGAGGSVVYFPGAPGSGTVSFDSMSELNLVNGAASVVYEVVDANPNLQESAQFPTFLGFPANGSGASVQTSEDFSLAPVSTVATVSSKDPIPRFQAVPVPSDCSIIGDCGAFYFPRLVVNAAPTLQFAAQAGSVNQVAYFQINNQGGGVMRWSNIINYTNGSGWLKVDPTDGVNNATVRVDAIPGSLAPGTYQAIITVDAGPMGGTRNIPVTLVIVPAPAPPAQLPMVTSVVNAASFTTGPLAPGSIATILGSKLAGTGLTVTFDGQPANVMFNNDAQINVVVPASLQSKTSTQLIVQVNGLTSVSQTVALAPFAPGIFRAGILNQDNSVNDAGHPAPQASIIQIFATGLSGNGSITARIGDRVIDPPIYAGPAPGLAGVQQVNLMLPADLTGLTANVSVCGGASPDQVVCSPAVQVILATQ